MRFQGDGPAVAMGTGEQRGRISKWFQGEGSPGLGAAYRARSVDLCLRQRSGEAEKEGGGGAGAPSPEAVEREALTEEDSAI